MKRFVFCLAALCAGTPAFALDLTSPDIGDGAPIDETFVFDGWGCPGQNVSPELSWSQLGNSACSCGKASSAIFLGVGRRSFCPDAEARAVLRRT